MSPTALRREIGRLLIAGFNGDRIPVELKGLAREFGLGGVILLPRNVVEPEQVAEVCYEASRLVPDLPPWVSIDQEGGRVTRLKAPFTEWPPMATLGRSGDAALADLFARALASELKAVGITLDYAPVLDVRTNPGNRVIGDRALSEKAEEVARLGASVIRALQGEGVAACGKHFPGHGDTAQDSHLELPVVRKKIDELKSVELPPFVHACRNEVEALMTAHVLYPALDANYPATLSRRIVGELLRGELGYDGVVFSDDLEMKAVSENYSVEEAVRLGLLAGIDVLLFGHEIEKASAAFDFLCRETERNREIRERVEASYRRIQNLKNRKLAAFTGATQKRLEDLIEEHEKIVAEIQGSR